MSIPCDVNERQLRQVHRYPLFCIVIVCNQVEFSGVLLKSLQHRVSLSKRVLSTEITPHLQLARLFNLSLSSKQSPCWLTEKKQLNKKLGVLWEMWSHYEIEATNCCTSLHQSNQSTNLTNHHIAHSGEII